MKEREWNLEERLKELYDECNTPVLNTEYYRYSLNNLYDGFKRIMDHYNNSHDVYYIVQNLIPVLERLRRENNYAYFDEVVDFILSLNCSSVDVDTYIRAFYLPYHEVVNDFPQLICAMHDHFMNIDRNKKYEFPLINLIIKYGEYAQERISCGDSDFLINPEYLLDCLTATTISYVYRNNIEIDIIPFFHYIKQNEQFLKNYYEVNGKPTLSRNNILYNNKVMHHMVSELIEQFKNGYGIKQIV